MHVGHPEETKTPDPNNWDEEDDCGMLQTWMEPRRP
jgi:hypothetical protein